MNRRALIKTLGISAVGLATVPFWIDSWTAEDLPENDGFLTGDQQLQLAELVNILIPKTNIPGAKELEVEKFISVMVRDCYSELIKVEFLSGFEELNTFSNDLYNNDFIKLTEAERMDVLCTRDAYEKPHEKNIHFPSFVKSLAIAGFMSSQYIMKNHLDYEMIPSRFHGSFPITQSIYTNLK